VLIKILDDTVSTGRWLYIFRKIVMLYQSKYTEFLWIFWFWLEGTVITLKYRVASYQWTQRNISEESNIRLRSIIRSYERCKKCKCNMCHGL